MGGSRRRRRREAVAYLGFHKGGGNPSLPFPLPPFPSLPSLPYLPLPSPLPLPSLPLPLEVGPLIAARGSGGAL